MPERSHMLKPPPGETDHVDGSLYARVIVVEYGDFECPNCAQAYHAARTMRRRFGNHAAFIFRHYPLVEVHPHALAAAEAAEAAGRQGKFWSMHDRLFENQLHLKPHQLRQYALDLELNMDLYDWEISEHVYLQRIHEHIDGGQKSGVRGTPTFFVNGTVQDVSFGLERLFQAVEAALGA
jgi:protein-disulfide isomerase